MTRPPERGRPVRRHRFQHNTTETMTSNDTEEPIAPDGTGRTADDTSDELSALVGGADLLADLYALRAADRAREAVMGEGMEPQRGRAAAADQTAGRSTGEVIGRDIGSAER
jgi:hypothetical protein